MAFTPGMERQANVEVTSSGVSQFTGQMGNASSSLMNFRQAVGAAGAALAALGTGAMAASINAAREFEDAMVELEKVADPETVEELDESIRDMSETIPLAQEEIAGLATDAARFGIDGAENIENFTETVARMSTATDLAADEAGESLAKLTELMDVPIEQAEELGSAINIMGNEFATSQSEVVEASLRSSAALEGLGLRETEIVGLNAAMNEVSESSRRAGTRLRRVAQELMDPGKAEDVANALGMSVDEFEQIRDENPAELIRDMATAFDEGDDRADALRETLTSQSQQAVAGLASNLDGLDEAMGRSNEAFEDGGSLQDEFERQVDTTNSQIQLLQNRIRNISIAIGEVFLPIVNDLLGWFNDALDPISDLIDRTDGMAGAVAVAGAAIGGLALAIGAFVSGPLGIAIASVAGLAAAYKTNFIGIRDVVDGVFERLGELFGIFTDDVIPQFVEAGERIRDEFMSVVDTFEGDGMPILETVIHEGFDRMADMLRWFSDEVLPDLLDAAVWVFATVTDAAEWFIENVLPVLADGFDHLMNAVDDVMPAIQTAVEDGLDAAALAFEYVSRAVEWFAENVLPGAMQAFERIMQVVERTIPVVVETLESAVEFLEPLVERHVGRLLDLYETHFEALVGEAIETFDHITDRIETFVDLVRPVVETFLAGVMFMWDLWGDELIGITRFMFDAISGVVTTALDGIVTAIRVALALIRGDWTEAFEILGDFARRTFDGLLDFVGEWSGRFLDALVSWADDAGELIRSAINDALGLPFTHTIGAVDVGGQEVFGGHTLSIPALAEGGLVEGPTMAMLAEAGEPEVVSPLSDVKDMVGAGGGGGDVDVTVRFEGEGALVDVVQREAEVTVGREFDRRERRVKRLGSRGVSN